MAGLAVAGATALTVAQTSAGAVGGYQITGASLGLNVRSGPGTGFSTVGTLANGTPVDIACQAKGTLVGVGLPGTPTDVWDRLNGPVAGWITDYYTTTPGLGGAFTPGIPQCGTTAPAPPPPPPAPPAVDCNKVLFLGLRGSNEMVGPQGLGPQGSIVNQTYDQLAARGVSLDRLTNEQQGAYPAVPFQVQNLFGPAFLDSVHRGTQVLLAGLRARTAGSVCGWERTKAVLVGYSQGAWAVADAIGQMTPAERSTIRGVVLYGDPTYAPFVNGAAGPVVTRGGAAGPRVLPYPDGVGARTRSYCLIGDPVCSLWGLPNNQVTAALGTCLAQLSICPHFQYGTRLADAVTFLKSRTG